IRPNHTFQIASNRLSFRADSSYDRARRRRVMRTDIRALSMVSLFSVLVPHTAIADDNPCGKFNFSAQGTLECHLETSGGCSALCTPLDFQAECSGECTASIDPQCAATCQGDCSAECTADPGSLDCEGRCEANCETDCKGQCSGASCEGNCKASCQG